MPTQEKAPHEAGLFDTKSNQDRPCNILGGGAATPAKLHQLSAFLLANAA
jgi:hypothetical protein